MSTTETLEIVNLILAKHPVDEIRSIEVVDGDAEIVAFHNNQKIIFHAFMDYEDLDSEWELLKPEQFV